ncbi:hypothetical protein CFC21_050783 [Triticum aestivum]|uniref:KIB1-4 beta-propeller domain-containing protein n=3 Tax=Triticinae TaxID=1648030 RepID=A0A9R1G6G9_WHEAT|nr:hypothetical protein CFC21_050783 [Triticum aestivum]
MRKTRWPDLPADLLREISSRLRATADFVYFHAVCKLWRHSHEATMTAATITTDHFHLLPWPLSPYKDDDSLEYRRLFSEAGYRTPPPISGTGMNWLASNDDTTVRYFTVSPSIRPRTLYDPLFEGALSHLPLFPQGFQLGENPSGIVYSDGTILLYSKHNMIDEYVSEFRVALLCPGDDQWTVIQRNLEETFQGEFCIAYFSGNILVAVNDILWYALMKSTTATSKEDVLVHRPWSLPDDLYDYDYNYVLQSRGELLWVTVHITTNYRGKQLCRGLVHGVLMFIHSLEQVDEERESLRWVRKEGKSLADRVLFLGWPNSFAVEASLLGVNGGLAYFVFSDDKDSYPSPERHGLFRYNLKNMTAQGWDNEMCTWLNPQLAITPIPHGPATTRSNSMIHIQRYYGPCFRVLVRNLPISAKSSQLLH